MKSAMNWSDALKTVKAGIDRRGLYSEYLNSDEWQARRVLALKRAAGRCQLCNAAARLQVHHRTYERVGNEMLEDLTVLCDSCHAAFHGKDKRAATRRSEAGAARRFIPTPQVLDLLGLLDEETRTTKQLRSVFPGKRLTSAISSAKGRRLIARKNRRAAWHLTPAGREALRRATR